MSIKLQRHRGIALRFAGKVEPLDLMAQTEALFHHTVAEQIPPGRQICIWQVAEGEPQEENAEWDNLVLHLSALDRRDTCIFMPLGLKVGKVEDDPRIYNQENVCQIHDLVIHNATRRRVWVCHPLVANNPRAVKKALTVPPGPPRLESLSQLWLNNSSDGRPYSSRVLVLFSNEEEHIDFFAGRKGVSMADFINRARAAGAGENLMVFGFALS